MLLLTRKIGLIRDLDHNLHLLKRHLPYHESDHVLNIAFNILAGGQRLEHIELRRNDAVYLDALVRRADPRSHDRRRLLPSVYRDRCPDPHRHPQRCPPPRLGPQQPPEFFDQAILDADGTLVATAAECKQGVDLSYKGIWGYHPLILSLANTGEPLYLVNRSGNRPSHEHADIYFDKAIHLCREAGFRRIILRGDTDFTQTKHLDRWDQAGDVWFYFGIDAMPNLKALAEQLPADAYSFLERPPRYEIKTVPRQTPEPVKRQIVRQRQFETIHLLEEMIAEFDYRPVACQTSYRVIVLRKRLGIDKGDVRLREEYRYFFYLTNDRTSAAAAVVFQANDRCDQENLIAQLKSGVRALTTPVDTLISNGAYMVMASVAWSLKAWVRALLMPVTPRHAATHRAEQRVVADGVRDLSRGGDRDAVPARSEWRSADLSVVVVDTVARRVPASGGAVAGLLVVLRRHA